MNNPKSLPEQHYKGTQSNNDSNILAKFRDQAVNNRIYNQYLSKLGIDIENVSSINQIPFLPIEFFKHHVIKTNDWQEEKVFESSGTTGISTSKHYIRSTEAYLTNARVIFEAVFGPIKGKCILGLLPSYLERSNSSLVSMVDHFITRSENPVSGFYLYDTNKLIEVLVDQRDKAEVILFGVTFALLDLAEQNDLDLSHVTIIETGGMKGRREEIIKEELYEILRRKLAITKIYSEYGMTELLSQAYGESGRMRLPDTMKVLIRDINDPFTYLSTGKTGGINIIDLANTETISFIETKDLGRLNDDGSFEILGRFDNSDLRGCNLLIS